VDGLGVIPHTSRSSILLAVRAGHAGALGVKHLLVGSGKRAARSRPWKRNGAKVLPLGTEYLNAGIAGGNIQTAGGVDAHTVSISAAFQGDKGPWIFGGTVRLDIESHDRLAIGRVDGLLIQAQHQAVSVYFLTRNQADFAGGIDVVNPRRIVVEIRATLGISDDLAHAPACLISH